MLKTLEKITDHYFVVIGSYFLSAVFIYAGLDKAFHFNGFQNALASYVLIPTSIASYLAAPVILAELWVGIGLLTKVWRKPAAFTATAMLLLFTMAWMVNYIYDPSTFCGCWFTITLGDSTAIHIIFNVLMLGIAYMIFIDGVTFNKQELAADKEP